MGRNVGLRKLVEQKKQVTCTSQRAIWPGARTIKRRKK
jgi:hypothetical protein